MFNMNPLNLPDAQLQLWIMLFGAGLLGFMIGYVSRYRTVHQLESEIAQVDEALADYFRVPTSAVAPPAATMGVTQEAIILNRIRARASELNFDRIGRASADEADDLQVIGGIGPLLERKLNAIDIYTFRQIANFNEEDIEQINDIIEYFPGRIERDRWVSQAKELARTA